MDKMPKNYCIEEAEQLSILDIDIPLDSKEGLAFDAKNADKDAESLDDRANEGRGEAKRQGEKLSRESIARRAESLFFKLGFDNFSIEELMEEFNASKSSFYSFFESKQELIMEFARAHVLSSFEKYKKEAENKAPKDKLEILLYYITPFRYDEEEFLAALIALNQRKEGKLLSLEIDEEKKRLFYPALEEILYELNESGYAYYFQESLPKILFKTQLCYQQLLINEAIKHLKLGEKEPKGCYKLLLALRFLWIRSLSLPFESLSIIELDELFYCLKSAFRRMDKYLPSDLKSIQTGLDIR